MMDATTQKQIETAYHQEAFDRVEQLCREACAVNATDALAWRWLGIVQRRRGQRDEAASSWARATTRHIEPMLGQDYARLLRELQRPDEAVDILQRCCEQNPDAYDVWVQWGVTLAELQQVTAALQVFQTTVTRFPHEASAHHNLGVAYIQSQQLPVGVAALQQALQLRPHYPEAHYSLGNAYAAQRQWSEAIIHLRQAVALRPNYPEALNNLGFQLTDAGRFDEAIVYLEQALRLRPDFSEAQANLGIALEAVGRYDEAEVVLRRVLERDPLGVEAHTNWGNLAKARGRLVEALTSYELALQQQPDAPATHYNRALAMLQHGQWPEGWTEYEWRLRRPMWTARYAGDRPFWDGTPGHGRTILVWAEQGLGDTIQFVRFVALLPTLGFRVLVQGPDLLGYLLRSLAGVATFVPEGALLPPHDVQCPLMSLPHHLRTTLTSVPLAGGYLRAEPTHVAKWAAHFPRDSERTIGLYWQGNPHHRGDRHRSVPLWEWASLATIPNVRWVSLQQGPGREQVASCISFFEVRDLGTEYQTMDDLAAVAQQVDLVISVDTATAHVAGALGKPVWLLIAASPDWRWLLGRRDTPWYTHAHLFRQQRLGKWANVFQDIRETLRAWIAAPTPR